jgi:hypothetical protein
VNKKQHYWLQVASRAEKETSVERKHALFFENIKGLAEPWGLGVRPVPSVPQFKGDVVAVSNLRGFFGRGVRKAQLLYPYREDFADRSTSDDRLTVVLDPERVDLRHLIYTVIPTYIEAFGAYVAELFDEQFIYRDPEEFERLRGEVNGPNDLRWNPRFSIHRVGPVSFFDQTLCRRAFNLSLGEVLGRLQGRIEHARVFQNGVYLVGASRIVPFDDAQRLCREMAAAIRC